MSTPFDITVYNKLGKEDLQRFVFNKVYQQISNTTVLQLNNLREKHCLPVSYLLKWVGQLTGKDLPLEMGTVFNLIEPSAIYCQKGLILSRNGAKIERQKN